MGAKLLAGKPAAMAIRADLKARIAMEREASGKIPGLAVVLVGEDPASQIYVASKHKTALALGMNSFEHRLGADVGTEDVLDLVHSLNADAAVHGILVQFPLPPHVDTDRVLAHIAPHKDVDGLTQSSQGALLQNRPGLRPCTAVGIIDLLRYYEVPLASQRAVVIGRSALVGLPVSLLLMRENATVTMIHSRTRDPAYIAREADLLIVAAGQPRLVDKSWIKPGAVVVDVGINRTGDGLVGDVNQAQAVEIAQALTPVPGGVGPMTIAELMKNTWTAFDSQINHD